MKWILKKTRRILPGILLLAVIGTLTSLLGVFFALISKRVIDVATGQSSGNLLHEAVVLSGFLLLQLLLQILLSVVTVYVNGQFNIYCRTELFTTILQKEYLKIAEFHTGELLNRINSDVSVLSGGMTQMLPNFLFYITKIIGVFWALYVLDPTFALLCLCLGPIIFLSALLYRKRMKSLHKECQSADGRVKSFMLETLKNLLVIKSFGCDDAAAQKSKDLQTKHFRLTLRRNRISITANVFYYIGLTAGYYAALAWGAYKISAGIMTFGTLTALLQLVGQIQTPFQGISSLLPQLYAMLASAERLQEIENLPDDPVAEIEDNTTLPWESISLSDIHFSYRDEAVLSGANFTVNRGEFIVISGTSGTGKSTLLKIMLGILPPAQGQASVYLADGSMHALSEKRRRLFAYVPQGNLIISGSIRENIAFFNTKATEEQIIEAAKIAQIWGFISELPDGLNTLLGENGLGLSEGQAQRLAVARAVLYNAPVLLLDEATSALDEETELAILTALKAQKDKTCILVSHKKAALSFCDRVVHFENGSLLENPNYK
ncbi:MAG: ABC transporter ATP-binding protein [Ruminococcaceae bacterium]|nr:ABC transporter ATP-binding protein [Oscillospiraceae bacterium]